MSRNHTVMLGFFVIAGFIALFATMIVFVFIPQRSVDYSKGYVVYFQGKLTGLHVGSLVTVRGIKVGEVTDLGMEYDAKEKRFTIPVYINFMKKRSGDLVDHVLIRKFIREGLRAELHVDNLLTGNAVIEIKIRPKSKGYTVAQTNSKFIQIPSIHEDEQPANLNAAIDAAKEMFESINELAKSPEIPKTLKSVTNAANSTKVLADNIYDYFPILSNSIVEGFQGFNDSIYSIRALSEILSRHPESLIIGKNASTNQ